MGHSDHRSMGAASIYGGSSSMDCIGGHRCSCHRGPSHRGPCRASMYGCGAPAGLGVPSASRGGASAHAPPEW
eukprot:2229103-Prymnesium_polylepis.1